MPKISLTEFTAARDSGRPILLTGAPSSPWIPRSRTSTPATSCSQVPESPRSEPTCAPIPNTVPPPQRPSSSIPVGRSSAPGFVDTHRHAWEAQLRRSIPPDVADLGEYVTSTLAGIAPNYAPEDMYIGTRLAALTALDSGITTMLDFSHNSRSSAHSDAALNALIDTGIRGVHASMGPHFGQWDTSGPPT